MGSKSITEAGALQARARRRLADVPPGPQSPRPADALLHELQVHQVELELQNEDLRRAHAELEESRDLFADLYEHAPVGYFTLDRAGVIVSANHAATALLGEPYPRFIGWHFSASVVPEHRDLWQSVFTGAVTRHDLQAADLALLARDDEHVPVRISCLCADREDSAVRVTVTDIRERIRAEKQLRIAEIAFETESGVIITDGNAVIIRVNRAFTRLTGYDSQDVVGHNPSLLHSGRQPRSFYDAMWATLTAAGYWQGEVWNRRKDGEVYPSWLSISAVRSGEGRITHYVGTFTDISKAKQAEAEIHRLAYYDPLTQLPNRRMLHDWIGRAIARNLRSGQHGALLFLDLDNFKVLNDTRGHAEGDELLVAVAGRLRSGIREGDTVARLGGDEFVVVLEDLSTHPNEAAHQAALIGEKLRHAIAQPFEIGGDDHYFSVSIGVALFRGNEESIDTLLRHADLAMYRAKDVGRDAMRFFDPQMQDALNERTAIEVELRKALEAGQMHLHYQAQFDCAGGILGAELLLRWDHPRRGAIGPDVFIPIAEETGLILPIGRWVIERACEQIREWSRDERTRGLHLAVNVSVRQFRHPDFVADVRDALMRIGADPTRLRFELTESLLLENVGEAIVKMEILCAMGIEFALDDFGTGFSSLSYLQRLPLSELKIDRSFVSELLTSRQDAAIVQTILTIGRSMDLRVVAEGVETREQLERLREYGCEVFQGYYFSRPVPGATFERLLEDSARRA